MLFEWHRSWECRVVGLELRYLPARSQQSFRAAIVLKPCQMRGMYISVWVGRRCQSPAACGGTSSFRPFRRPQQWRACLACPKMGTSQSCLAC